MTIKCVLYDENSDTCLQKDPIHLYCLCHKFVLINRNMHHDFLFSRQINSFIN